MLEKNSRRAEICAGHNVFSQLVAVITVLCIACTLSFSAFAVETTDILCQLDHEHDQSCDSAAVPTETEEAAQESIEIMLHAHNEFCYDSENNVICPLPELEEHTHADDCYEIPVQETAPAEQTHIHSSECYTRERGVRICTVSEPSGHIHTDACYETAAKEETIHEHTDECYTRQRGELTCVLPEFTGHMHEDTCYIPSEELVCMVEESEEHIHENSCYGKVLGCVTKESAGHVHDDACYEWTVVCACGLKENTSDAAEPEKTLVCTEQEQLAHVHSDSCYGEGAELICGRNEIEEHIHADDCYEWLQVLSCGQKELSDERTDAIKSLICSKAELTKHIHEDSCYEVDSAGALCLKCDLQQIEEHQHTEDCLGFSADSLLCELEACDGHVHSYTCYSSWTFLCQIVEEPDEELTEEPVEETTAVPESDPTADVEWRKDWEKTFEHVELTGAWSHDLLAIAQTQLDYRESERNFITSESGDKKGYTRYGHWYGVHYGDWCAMFASFCLNYAEIEEFPLHCNCARWIDVLTESEMYVEADACMPRPGDLVFIDYGRKSRASQNVPANADHVAIVAEVLPATQEEPARIVTIEGNHNDCVCYETRSLDDPKIMGYGLLPDGPAAIYSCGIESHTHETDCYDEEDNLICQALEHVHDEVCRSRNLQFADESMQVDIVLTNAVYVPENLSLNVELLSGDEVSPRSMMRNALESAMSERSYSAADFRFCRVELLADGQPYQLPIGVQANVQISFAEPAFSAESISNAAQMYTFMQAKETDGKAAKQKPYQLEVIFEAEYENAADGMTGLSFATNHISEFAVVLAGTAQESDT